MKIIAKTGTAFEQTVKMMCEKMTEGTIGAMDMVANTVGVRPRNVFHIFHWGTISLMVPEFDFDPDDRERIDLHILRKKKGCGCVYVPALRFKEGKELNATFRKFAEEHEVTEEPLNEYGIHMVNWKDGISYRINPVHDTKNNRYMLICSDSIPKAFNKNKLKSEQFDIEY